MKYLEKFNWFRKKEKEKEVDTPLKDIDEQVIKDICLELEDLGLFITYEDNMIIGLSGGKIDYPFQTCNEVKFIGHIEWENMKDSILRLKEYLGNRYIKFWYRTYSNPNHRNALNWSERIKLVNIDENTKIPIILISGITYNNM